MDFRELTRRPEKLFGYSYLYFLLLVSCTGLLYVLNLSTVGKNAAPPATPRDSLAADLPLQSPRVIPPVDVMKAGISSGELIARGGELYKANCAACHGDEGRGDGASAALMNPKPRNFHSPLGWTNGAKVSQIYKTLQEGIVRNGMASFSYLPPGDRFAIIHYVRSFNPDPPTDTPEELKALDAEYGLSKGTNVPGQIPVKRALAIVVEEASGEVEAVSGALRRARSSSAPGAVILHRVAADERKVLTVFSGGRSGPLPPAPDFIREVSLSPILAGFRPDVVNLTRDDWMTMYRYISELRK